jgi:cysteine-rich repeat protein
MVADTYYPNSQPTDHWLSWVWLNANADLVSDGGGSDPKAGGSPAQVPLVRDAWVQVVVTIDLGARTYSATYGGKTLVTNRTWSLGSAGSLRGAVFLWGPSITSPVYVDDLTIEKLQSWSVCGNGMVEDGEQCDLGATNSNAAGTLCDTTCHTPLVAWLDGSDPNADGSRPADGSAVALWRDKARRNHATQVVPAKQPRYVANGLGTGALAFDGREDFMGLPININVSALPAMTVVVVYQNAQGHTSSLAGLWGNDDMGWDRFLVSGGLSGWSGVSMGNGPEQAPALGAENVPLIAVTTLVNGGDSTMHVNGKQAGKTFAEAHTTPGTPSMSIGNLEGPEFKDPDTKVVIGPRPTGAFDGMIAELMVFDRALSPAARNHLGKSLAAKYRLASYCGDGVTGPGEDCDDGVNDGVGCSATCTTP